MREFKYDVIRCPSGSAGVVEYDGCIVKVLLLDSGDEPEAALLKLLKKGTALRKGKLEGQVYEWFRAYMRRVLPVPYPLKLEADGTKFQQKVWERTLKIPFGEVLTYGQLAAEIGCASAQAVGQALGRNPIPIIIPCHRVIAAGMKLGGFTGGTHLKIKLLEHEGWALNNGVLSMR